MSYDDYELIDDEAEDALDADEDDDEEEEDEDDDEEEEEEDDELDSYFLGEDDD